MPQGNEEVTNRAGRTGSHSRSPGQAQGLAASLGSWEDWWGVAEEWVGVSPRNGLGLSPSLHLLPTAQPMAQPPPTTGPLVDISHPHTTRWLTDGLFLPGGEKPVLFEYDNPRKPDSDQEGNFEEMKS